MRAAWYERGGPASEALTVAEMDAPRPGPGEVLVRVRASGVNPWEVKPPRPPPRAAGVLRGPVAAPRTLYASSRRPPRQRTKRSVLVFPASTEGSSREAVFGRVKVFSSG